MARMPEQWRFLMGDEVLTADGASLGLVLGFIPEDPADGTPDYLIVEKGIITLHDLYIPVAAVSSYAGGRIVLAVTQDEIPGKGWEQPPAAPAR